jgi:hypothetical protein
MKVKTITIQVKATDTSFITYHGPNGIVIASEEGNLPNFLPGANYGEYLSLDIDLATGKILNWTSPSQDEISQCLEELNDQER